MIQDFLGGVGGGLLVLLGLAFFALFALWVSLPVLVLRLVQTNRVLTEEVRQLRDACEKGKGGDPSAAADKEGPDGEGRQPPG